jgi:hypothetical protein
MADLNLAKYLAPRQKRLQYWRASFRADTLPEAAQAEVGNKLSTYALLLSKLSKPQSEAEMGESRQKLEKLEQELGALFELKRSKVSRLAINKPSETLIYKPR